MADLYRFTLQGADYNFTDLPFEVSWQDRQYVPTSIRRSSIQHAGVENSRSTTLRVEMPRNLAGLDPVNQRAGDKSAVELVTLCMRLAALPRLDIMAYSTNLQRVIINRFSGRVTRPVVLESGGGAGPEPAGFALFEVTPAPLRIEGQHQSRYYQTTCNNILYDHNCRVSRSRFSVTTHIRAIDRIGKSMTLAGGSRTAGYYQGGSLLFAHDGVESYRKVIRHVGRNIELENPFGVPLPVGSIVRVSAGCDRSLETCINKFNNGSRFGGMPGIPVRNPGDIALGQADVERNQEDILTDPVDTTPITFTPIGDPSGFNPGG